MDDDGLASLADRLPPDSAARELTNDVGMAPERWQEEEVEEDEEKGGGGSSRGGGFEL